MSTRMQIHSGKGQVNSLYNVGHVREIIYIGTALTKEKESRVSTTFKRIKKWKKWEETCQGFMQTWTKRKKNINTP
jgi:hypothetical protein